MKILRNTNLIINFKEIIRHLLFLLGIYNLLILKRNKKYITVHLNSRSRKEIFKKIYNLGVWVHEDNQSSISGKGSELFTTKDIIEKLPDLLEKLSVKKLVDIGCGDWNWFSKIYLDKNINYTGIDIVEDLIIYNKKKYSSNKVNFLCLDAVEDELPSSDAVICREVIFHLNFQDGKKLINNIKKNSKWLIITSDPSIWFNSNIPTGDFRRLNLEKSPFNFPKPSFKIDDNRLEELRILGVWRTEDLP